MTGMSSSTHPTGGDVPLGEGDRRAELPRIVAFPYYVDNPYLDLLYADAVRQGVRIDKPTAVGDAIDRIRELDAGDIIHLHWTTPICQPFPSALEAARRLIGFCVAVGAARRRRVRFIWTVHNLQPHELAYPRLERWLTTWILRNADDVVVLNPHTPKLARSLYKIPPAKVRLLPHCSYVGAYPNEISDDQARSAFDIPPEDLVIGFVGEQRPYKGIPELLRAFDHLRSDHPGAHLLLGGRVREQDRADIKGMLAGIDGLIVSEGRISDDEIQLWFKATNVMVFPYRQTLNSGSMFLAATFGRPCVLPAAAALTSDWSGEPWIEFYRPDEDAAQGIAAAVERLLLRWPDAHQSALRFAMENLPDLMAKRFSTLIGLPSTLVDEETS